MNFFQKLIPRNYIQDYISSKLLFFITYGSLLNEEKKLCFPQITIIFKICLKKRTIIIKVVVFEVHFGYPLLMDLLWKKNLNRINWFQYIILNSESKEITRFLNRKKLQCHILYTSKHLFSTALALGDNFTNFLPPLHFLFK